MKRYTQASAALDLRRHLAGVPAAHARSLHDGNRLAAQACAVHYAFWLLVSCFCSLTSPGPSPPWLAQTLVCAAANCDSKRGGAACQEFECTCQLL